MQVGDYPEMVFSNFKAGSLHRLWSQTGPNELKKTTKFRGDLVEFERLINHGRYFDELTQMWPTVAAICPRAAQPRQGDPNPITGKMPSALRTSGLAGQPAGRFYDFKARGPSLQPRLAVDNHIYSPLSASSGGAIKD